MIRHAFRLLALAVCAAPLAAQAAVSAPPLAGPADVSLEMLVRAAENRIGVYALHLGSGAEVRINADVSFPAGSLAALLAAADGVGQNPGTETRPADPSAEFALTRSLLRDPEPLVSAPKITPRAAATAIASLRRTAARNREGVLAGAFGETATESFGGALSPFVETGCFATRDPEAPGVAGYVIHPRGEIVVCVLTNGFRSADNATALLPAVVAAAVVRLGGGIAEPEAAAKTAPVGSWRASLHEARRDAELFEVADLGDGRMLADRREARQSSAFKIGEKARVGVIGFPASRERIGVQWSRPSGPDGRRTVQTLIEGRTVSDRTFDLALDLPGTYRVRVVAEGALLLDRTFYVTAP